MKRIIGLLLFMLAASGCGSQQPTEVLPTLMPTPQPAAAATETPVSTVAPPTQVPVDRPTLPPTWTPSVEPTNTLIPPTNTPLPLATPIPTLVACGPFDVDRDKSASTFTVGTPTQVFWTPIQGAVRYRIFVIGDFNQEIFSDYAVDASYTFKPDAFEAGKQYLWKVYPEDSLARQMCFAVSGDLSSN
ncbi:MAG: hypothetical protein GC179_18145 [Anaerolineaceae bacterium]|nr:hypothetical protein [Anaerolineaceae bacterium]